MKMRSRSGDTCMVVMYPPLSMCGPSMVSLGCMVMEKLIYSQKLDNANKFCDLCRKSNTYVSHFATFVAGKTKITT